MSRRARKRRRPREDGGASPQEKRIAAEFAAQLVEKERAATGLVSAAYGELIMSASNKVIDSLGWRRDFAERVRPAANAMAIIAFMEFSWRALPREIGWISALTRNAYKRIAREGEQLGVYKRDPLFEASLEGMHIQDLLNETRMFPSSCSVKSRDPIRLTYT